MCHRRGAVARSVVCPFRMQAAASLVEKISPSSADSRKAKWALNTGKLSPGGVPRNRVIKKLTVP